MNGAVGRAGRENQENLELLNTTTHTIQALNIIHNPRSSNSLRQEASTYLEDVKSQVGAPYNGYLLAFDRTQPAIVRHFGLSLLENAVRHRWARYTTEEGVALRGWVVSLAQEVVDDDPLYLRHKIAEVWAEVAKRSWALDWMDMDELLVQLWNGPVVRKALVLTILETLSEDIFGHEDTTAGLRGTDLNRACVDIFTPASVLLEYFPNRDTSINVRYGEEGWLSRTGDFLNWCTQDDQMAKSQEHHAIKALSMCRSAFSWIMPGALITSRAFDRICRCVAVEAVPVQLVSASINHSLN